MTARDIESAVAEAERALGAYEDNSTSVASLAAGILVARASMAAGQQIADHLAAIEEQLRGIVNVGISNGTPQ